MSSLEEGKGSLCTTQSKVIQTAIPLFWYQALSSVIQALKSYSVSTEISHTPALIHSWPDIKNLSANEPAYSKNNNRISL